MFCIKIRVIFHRFLSISVLSQCSDSVTITCQKFYSSDKGQWGTFRRRLFTEVNHNKQPFPTLGKPFSYSTARLRVTCSYHLRSGYLHIVYMRIIFYLHIVYMRINFYPHIVYMRIIFYPHIVCSFLVILDFKFKFFSLPTPIGGP